MVRSLMSVALPIVCVGGLLAPVSAAHAVGKGSHASKAIRQLTLDDSAPVVELFDGVDAGQFRVKLVALSAQEANVFIKNATDAPLTVQLPKAAVGVHILPQFQQFPIGNNQFNPFGNNQIGNQVGDQFGNNQLGNNQLGNPFGNGLGNVLNQGIGNGQAQGIGGGFQPFGNQQQGFPNQLGNGLNQGMNGVGLFSIPPEKTVRLKMRTVCLDYGHPDPHVGLNYELRKLETVTTDPTLCELLESFSKRVDQDAMQAAAWHLANGLSWKQLSHLRDAGTLGVASVFNAKTLNTAQSLVEQAEAAAKDREQQPPAKPAHTPKVATRTAKAK